MPYKVVGGVRFYERKEVKDALAYLKLIINPHDDVSLRRIVNVPARGIGKGVMDALEESRAARPAELPPLLAAGLSRRCRRPRSGRGWCARSTSGCCRRAPLASLAAFRDLIVALTDVARHEPVSIALGKMLDRPGTSATCATSAARKPRAASRT